MSKSGKPAIGGLARPEGIVDDIGSFLFKKGAQAARKKGVKAYDKMNKMGPKVAESKFNKQYDKWQKSNAKADAMRAKANKLKKK